MEPKDYAPLMGQWLTDYDSLTVVQERALCDAGLNTLCEFEFGPHDEHSDCEWTLDAMNAPYPDERDYSGWYGGERGYQDGLRWSDFV